MQYILGESVFPSVFDSGTSGSRSIKYFGTDYLGTYVATMAEARVDHDAGPDQGGSGKKAGDLGRLELGEKL